MNCEKCKTEKASIFLTQIINGKMHKADLCERCAKEMGVTNAAGFSLTELLLDLKEEEIQKTNHSSLTCPNCGFTESDLQKSGRLGCPECYQVFHAHLEDALQEMHHRVDHTGKIPKRQRTHIETVQQVTALRSKLEKAISEENFEQAAKLRDQINQLETGSIS